jgi:hypothetical protein
VRDGRVEAVGGDAEVDALAGPGTRVVDLRGRLVVPGFNDAHVHFLDGGFSLLSVDLRPARDEAEFARRLGEHARTLPAGRWIRNGNWDHEAWPSKREPTRALVDPVTPEHPVFVNRLDVHMALANSLALRLAGVTRDTPDVPGGTIVKDARGEPTGLLKDKAMGLVSRVVPEPTREMNLVAARRALAEAARFGVTSVQDCSSIDALPTYMELRDRGELTARVYAWRPESSLPALRQGGVRPGLGDDRLRLGAVKIFSDGSMGSSTAAFFAPYADEPGNTGLLLHADGELSRLVEQADRDGFALAVHAIGDRANALVLDAFAAAAAANGPRDRRFRIEHAQHLRLEEVPRFARQGVIASMQPYHVIDDGRWAGKRLGSRVTDSYIFRSLLDGGVRLAFGSDWNVAPLDPIAGIYAAVTRRTLDGKHPEGWIQEQKISVEESLRAYTVSNAYAVFAEATRGMLRPGYRADLVLLDKDLFTIPPTEIEQTTVRVTVAGGQIVYQAQE